MEDTPGIPAIEGLRIHRERGRLIVALAYHPDTVARIKSVVGRRWHPAEKCWNIPYAGEAVAHLRPHTGVPRETDQAGAQTARLQPAHAQSVLPPCVALPSPCATRAWRGR